MKIALITFQRSVNYGTYMQCAQLKKWLEDKRAQVSVIDYQPDYRISKVQCFNSWRDTIPTKINRWKLCRKLKFRCYEKKNFNLTTPVHNKKEFLDLIEKCSFDTVLCGGDQIWNAQHTNNSIDPVYFGCPGEHSIPVHSYSSSFGTARLEDRYALKLKQYLMKFASVSVRELTAVNWLNNELSIAAVLSPDPVLLQSELQNIPELANSCRNGGHIGVYMFNRSPERFKLVEHEMAQSKKSAVYLFSGWIDKSKNMVAGKPDALWTFVSDASELITDSFHGLLVSILCNRPFTFVGLSGEISGRNQRIFDLIDSLNMNDKVIRTKMFGLHLIKVKHDIDWGSVNRSIQIQREHGEKYLNNIFNL